ncbi:adenosylcobinamide amidohydrolase [Halomonas sp. H10-9-1]|uniref:adenosylcobinamide amidohydrolase n=1 Tax=Halomonas sp. H10-9-1 TaxID=2950871 RepID=UPI0032E02698
MTAARRQGPYLGERIVLEGDARCLHFRSARPLRTVSSALVGGGLGWARHFCNFHVSKDYAGHDPVADLHAWLAARELAPGESVAMMTAVRLAELTVVEARVSGISLTVAVTAGVGNAVDITAPLAGDPRPVVGTINTLVFLDAHLTDGALVNACLSVSEAKVRALAECGVRDPHTASPATGTSTDCLAIAATQRGVATPYAGSATGLGRALGRAVFEATCQALGPAGQEGLT